MRIATPLWEKEDINKYFIAPSKKGLWHDQYYSYFFLKKKTRIINYANKHENTHACFKNKLNPTTTHFYWWLSFTLTFPTISNFKNMDKRWLTEFKFIQNILHQTRALNLAHAIIVDVMILLKHAYDSLNKTFYKFFFPFNRTQIILNTKSSLYLNLYINVCINDVFCLCLSVLYIYVKNIE